MKKYTAALLALLLLTTTLPALASSQGASPADIALWQSAIPAPCGEFQKITAVLTPDSATDTIHRRLATSQRGPVIDNSPRFLPIRMTAAEFWATLIPGDYEYMFDLNTDPDGMYDMFFSANRTSAIWAGNRIFEMLELGGRMYPLSGYNSANDTIDFSPRRGIFISLDEAIAAMEIVDWATWTRLY